MVIALLALSSLSAFAQSTNYQQNSLNDDGTNTIVGPRFNRANGTSQISSRSDLNGLCRLYGYDFSYGNLVVTSGDLRAETAVIDSNGKLKEWRPYGNNYSNSAIDSITCAKNRQVITPSRRVKPVRNDDGTFSLLNATAGNYNVGSALQISSTSNKNGVCAYFGLGRAIEGSVLTEGDLRGFTLVIGSTGQAESFRPYGNNYSNSVIKTISCERGEISGTPQPELNQTIEIPRADYLALVAKVENLERQNNDLRATVAQKDQEISRMDRKRAELEARIAQLMADLENEKKLNGGALRKLQRLQARLVKLGMDQEEI